MGTSRWVANASPLILLGNTELLHLLSGLAAAVDVPQAVVREIGAKPDGNPIIRALRTDPRFRLIDDSGVPPEVLGWDLGAGESQVIASATSKQADRVVIDDLEARRCAKAMGLRVIGTLGVVGRAKTAGLIPMAAPIIKVLRDNGLYVRDGVVEEILRQVGE